MRRALDCCAPTAVQEALYQFAFTVNRLNKTQRCLQRCDLQLETMMTTTSRFPNKETFPYRHELCYVLQKVAKICSDPVKKIIFEPNLKNGIKCSDILEMSNSRYVCSANDEANATAIESRASIVDFLFNYAHDNLAVLYVYIKDPYYTSITKDENIPFISFVGNAGGLLGLCLGLSFVSVFEIVYHLARNLWNRISICCKLY